jgi:hypothetical protein
MKNHFVLLAQIPQWKNHFVSIHGEKVLGEKFIMQEQLHLHLSCLVKNILNKPAMVRSENL